MRNTEARNLVSFYKIDKLLFPGKSEDGIIKEIMDDASDYYPESKLKSNVYNGYSVSMYYCHSPIAYTKWRNFFSPILADISDTFNNKNKTKFTGSYLSFVCFLYNKQNIYALCMGKAYLVIGPYIVDDFGFDLLTRLIKSNSPLLRQTTVNNLSGSIFEDINVFRSGESFISQDDFGKIFKRAISDLDSKAVARLGMDPSKIQNTSCLAKSSFMLKTGITLEEVTGKILPALTKIFKEKAGVSFQINKVKNISKQHPLYEDLKKGLCEEVRGKFLQFDFFSPEDAVSFSMAQQYQISKYSKTHIFKKGANDLSNIEQVYKILKDENLLDFSDKKAFATEIEHIMVDAYDDNDSSLLRQRFTLARGLHGELEYKGQKYFWLNGKFWQIDQDFLNYFNDRVFQNINESSYKITIKLPFDKFNLSGNEAEGDYNSRQGKKNDVYNLDKKLANKIELCDLLYETKDTIYLLHVKKGFDRDIRVLTSQILTAQRFLHEDKINFIKTIYDNSKGDPIKCSEADFIKKFDKQTVFVLAFVYKTDIFKEMNFKKISSNIAKLEILELLKDFKKFSPPYSLKILQLPIK